MEWTEFPWFSGGRGDATNIDLNQMPKLVDKADETRFSHVLGNFRRGWSLWQFLYRPLGKTALSILGASPLLWSHFPARAVVGISVMATDVVWFAK